MKYDENKIDEMILALMYLGLHNHDRSWKSFDWESLDRLHHKNLISTPASKNKSVMLTEEGLKISEQLFIKHFAIEG